MKSLDDDGVVVVPRLGSSREEEDVSRLLRRHGLRTARTRLRPTRRRSESQQDGDEDMEMTDVDEHEDRGDDMEVDELETECLSSAAGSRAGSPTPMTTYNPSSHTFSSPFAHHLDVIPRTTVRCAASTRNADDQPSLGQFSSTCVSLRTLLGRGDKRC
jgi:hypothetical protein